MNKPSHTKPIKKTDKEIDQLLQQKIDTRNYFFVNHAKQRLSEREILDIDVLNILEEKYGCKKFRNPSKDKYVEGYQDWNYCFEGKNCDDEIIRIII